MAFRTRQIGWGLAPGVLALLFVALAPVLANAGIIAINSVDIGGTSEVATWVPLSSVVPEVEADDDGRFSESGVMFLSANGGESPRIDWTISGDVDPELTGDFDVYNFANVDVTFTLSFDMNVGITLAAPVPTTGSVDIELIDMNSDGATLSTDAPDPVYQSIIDGSDHEPLLSDPYSLTASAGSSITDSANFAVSGPDITSTMGIDLVFTLSAGDRAKIVANFEAVPEPGSFVLLAAGLICLVGLRMRRK